MANSSGYRILDLFYRKKESGHTEYKDTVLVFLVLCLYLVPVTDIQGQTDTIKKKNILYYFELGLGPGTRGANFDMSFTISSSGLIGGSLNFMAGFVRLEDVPADYFDGIFRLSKPASTFSDLSLNLSMKFQSPGKPFRFGLEAGPSIIWYDELELVLNPNYPDLFQYKYDKIHTKHNIAGFYMAMKFEVIATEYLGADFNLFCNINGIQSLVGLDICISLGRLK